MECVLLRNINKTEHVLPKAGSDSQAVELNQIVFEVNP